MRTFFNFCAIKTLVVLGIVASACSSQEITISGTVKNSSGTPLSGAEVKLEKANKKTITDSNGKFTFKNTSTNAYNTGSQNVKLSTCLKDGVLFLNVLRREEVEISTYTLKGQVVFATNKVMDIGTHRMELANKGLGIYLYKIKIGNSMQLLKSFSIGSTSDGSLVDASLAEPRICGKNENVRIDDVLAVKKDNYLNYRLKVTNPDSSGIAISMIDCAGTVTDADGNVYQSVKIGNQVWTTEDLKTTKYNDGSAIPLVTVGSEWGKLSTPGYSYYDNKPENGKKYGILYNWYAASSPKIAPKGWRLPTHDEQVAHQNYLQANGYNYDGTTAENKTGKSIASKADWVYKKTSEFGGSVSDTIGMVGNNISTNNRTGFSALPAGCRWYDGSKFNAIGYSIYWWSMSSQSGEDAWHNSTHTWSNQLGNNHHSKRFGFCIRLIRN